MPKLDGHQASVLAFIARYPDSPEAAAQAAGLTGEVQEIANALIEADGEPTPNPAARAIQNWANPKNILG